MSPTYSEDFTGGASTITCLDCGQVLTTTEAAHERAHAASVGDGS